MDYRGFSFIHSFVRKVNESYGSACLGGCTHATQTKADQNASELAQVLRRERAGQGSIADAQAEVEELKGELGHMREAFARLEQADGVCGDGIYAVSSSTAVYFVVCACMDALMNQ